MLILSSSFIVSYHSTHAEYSFVTDSNSHENILLSTDRKSPIIRELSNLNFYKIESLEQGNSIEIEYQHQLKSLEKYNSIINYNLLYGEFKS